MDTGLITDVDRTDIMGVEAAYAHGPFSVVGEYSSLDANRDTEEDLSFDSWSVYDLVDHGRFEGEYLPRMSPANSSASNRRPSSIPATVPGVRSRWLGYATSI